MRKRDDIMTLVPSVAAGLISRENAPNALQKPSKASRPARKRPQTPRNALRAYEGEILRSILDYCAAERIFVKRRNVGGGKITVSKEGKRSYVKFGKAGQSDLWGIIRGRHVECECKRPGEEPTDIQRQWLQDCADAGALAFWCTSLDEFIEGIDSIRYGFTPLSLNASRRT